MCSPDQHKQSQLLTKTIHSLRQNPTKCSSVLNTMYYLPIFGCMWLAVSHLKLDGSSPGNCGSKKPSGGSDKAQRHTHSRGNGPYNNPAHSSEWKDKADLSRSRWRAGESRQWNLWVKPPAGSSGGLTLSSAPFPLAEGCVMSASLSFRVLLEHLWIMGINTRSLANARMCDPCVYLRGISCGL